MTWQRTHSIAQHTDAPELATEVLLHTPSVQVRDIACFGRCRHKSAEECAIGTHLVFPYRGTYVRHLASDEAVAESSQVLFFNANESYRISHPIAGGDANLDLLVDSTLLEELAPRTLLRNDSTIAFRPHRLRIDARAQALVALLRHALRQGTAEPLEAEGLALALVRRALGPRTARAATGTLTRRRLVDRVKLLLASDLSRRWTLADIANHVGGSPVYLTQVFQQVEGMPLYRYQLGLRLARALDLLSEYDDLTMLSLDLGFSSHSHFTAAFQRSFGRSPSDFRRSVLPAGRRT